MKKFSINEMVWFIILVGFAYFIYELLSTDRIYLFIHPKMVKYSIFSFIIFSLLAIIQLGKIFTKGGPLKVRTGFVIFLIPLLLAFVVKPQEISGEIVAKKGFDISNHRIGRESSSQLPNQREDTVSFSDMQNQSLEDRFMEIVDKAYDNLEELQGQEIELKGFIYKDAEFDKDKFIVARMLMACCAADAVVVGLMCEWTGGDELEIDQWVRVIGTLSSFTHTNPHTNQKSIVPIVKVIKLEQIKPLSTKYVFP